MAIAANAGYYADLVREKAILRRLVEASIRPQRLGEYLGQTTVREQLGIRAGSRIAFRVTGATAELSVVSGALTAEPVASGFGLVKPRRNAGGKAVPADFDVASLLGK